MVRNGIASILLPFPPVFRYGGGHTAEQADRTARSAAPLVKDT